MNKQVPVYTGILFELRKEIIELPSSFYRVEYVDQINEEIESWYSFRFRSEAPIIQEDYDRMPPFYYPFLARISHNKRRLLILSISELLINKLIIVFNWKDWIKNAIIKIPDLVNHLSSKPDIYCLSIVFAKVVGYGQSLRAISMYGTDLANSKLFLDILPKLVPFRVQLRDVRRGEDILQIGTRGEVSLNYYNQNMLFKIDKVLSFLTKHGFMIWDTDIVV